MTDNQQEKAVQRLSDEIIEALGNLLDYDTQEDRQKYFKETLSEAMQKLSKEEVINILNFVMVDYEIFFDIFESSLERSRNAASKG